MLDVLVHPDYRRNGIGTKLLETLICFKEMSVRGVILGTPTMSNFYESLGFTCVNEKAFLMVLISDEYSDGLIESKQ